MPTAQLKSDWRIHAIESVQEQFSGSTASYAIIEPLLWPECLSYIYGMTNRPNVTPLFTKTQFSHIENGPLVIEVTEYPEFLDVLIKKFEEMPCGCLFTIKQAMSWDSLLEMLRHRLMISNGSSPILLRYFDPRTLLPLLGSLTNEEREKIFNGFDKIIWFSQKWLSAYINGGMYTNDKSTWVVTDLHLKRMKSILSQW